MVSAIGMVVRFSEYILACFVTLLVFINLAVLKNIEDILPKNYYSILIVRTKGSEKLKIAEFINGYNIKALDTKIKLMKEQNIIEQEISFRYKNYDQLKHFLENIKNISNLLELHIS